MRRLRGTPNGGGRLHALVSSGHHCLQSAHHLAFFLLFGGDQVLFSLIIPGNSREALVSMFLFGGGGGDNISHCGA